MAATSAEITLRTNLEPGDLGSIVYLHGIIYAQEHGFDPGFEAYVAGPLAEFVRRASPRERLWIAERDGRIVGCIAIVSAAPEIAQLRWFLVDPRCRGSGCGTRLLAEAVDFARITGCKSVVLWTVSALTTAARLYERMGFEKMEERPAHLWGTDVVEEKYELRLTSLTS